MIQRHHQLQAEREHADFIAELLQGETWTPAEVTALEAQAQVDGLARRRELLADALTASQVAALLSVSRQMVQDRWQNGALLGVIDDGALRFPVWQFDAAGPDGVIEGLPEVVRALATPPLSKIAWMLRPHLALDNHTPLQSLQAGELSRVLQLARALGAF